MFKFKCYLNISKSVVLTALCWLLVFSQCTTYDREAIKAIKTLEVKLEDNSKNLRLDIDLITNRIENIERTLKRYKNRYKETFTERLGTQLSQFKIHKKIYTKQIAEYEFCVREQVALKEQLDNLRKDVISNKLNHEQFKAYFKVEKEDVQHLINRSKNIKKTLYEIEPDYLKLNKALDIKR